MIARPRLIHRDTTRLGPDSSETAIKVAREYTLEATEAGGQRPVSSGNYRLKPSVWPCIIDALVPMAIIVILREP